MFRDGTTQDELRHLDAYYQLAKPLWQSGLNLSDALAISGLTRYHDPDGKLHDDIHDYQVMAGISALIVNWQLDNESFWWLAPTIYEIWQQEIKPRLPTKQLNEFDLRQTLQQAGFLGPTVQDEFLFHCGQYALEQAMENNHEHFWL